MGDLKLFDCSDYSDCSIAGVGNLKLFDCSDCSIAGVGDLKLFDCSDCSDCSILLRFSYGGHVVQIGGLV